MRSTAFFKLYKICILLHRCNLKILAKNQFLIARSTKRRPQVKKAAVLPFAPPDPLKNLLGPMVAPREAIRLHALGARRGYTGAAAIIAAAAVSVTQSGG